MAPVLAAIGAQSSLLVLSLLVGFLAAFLGYGAARRFEARSGVAAWRLPAGGWAFIFFLSWLIGLLLFFISRPTTHPPAPPGAPPAPRPLSPRQHLDFSHTEPAVITVVMVLYEKFEPTMQALTSLRANFTDGIELILVDNASTDATVAMVELAAASNDKVRLFRNDRDLGIVGNFNACLMHAQGEYIKFLCADDLLLPSCLERMAAVLDEHADAALVAGGRMLVDEQGAQVGMRRCADTMEIVPGEMAIDRCLFGANAIGEPTAVMFRRAQASRGFREDLSHLMDLEMWFYLLEQGDLACLPEPLCAVRRHAGQMTMHSIKSGALVEDNIRLFEAYGGKPYVRHGWRKESSRRLRLAYRIWLSRRHLDPARRREILRRYSSPWAYRLVMPMLGPVLSRLGGTYLLRRRRG